MSHNSPTPNPESGPRPSGPPQTHTAPLDGVPIICFTRCWNCQWDDHPRMPHTWMDQEDAEHAGHPWPLPDEIAAANPCPCHCAKEPDHA